MASNYPTSLDNFTNPASGDKLDNPSHSSQHTDLNNSVEALETKLGIGSSSAGSATAGYALVHSTGGTTAWSTLGTAGIATTGSANSGAYLMIDNSGLASWSTQGAASFRNLIINGDMQVAQRGTSVASITSSGYNTADRFAVAISSLGTWTQSVENDAPTGSGFRKSLKMLCTTADASPAAGDYLAIRQKLEGQNCQSILKGTANAKQISLSFWIKSNVTGTYVAELVDSDNTRQVSASYTVSASATWEKKTVTFPADTTGALDNDNAESLELWFWLGAGTTYSGGTLQTTWGNTAANRAAGQTNLASAINNYWQITGVQLEVGSIATGFEFLPYDQNLQRCQRYYFRSIGDNAYSNIGTGQAASTTGCNMKIQPLVPFRAAPTSVEFSTLRLSDEATAPAVTAITINSSINSRYLANLDVTVASGLTAQRMYTLQGNNSTSAYLGLSAEL